MKGKKEVQPAEKTRAELAHVKEVEGDKYPFHVINTETGSMLARFPYQEEADRYINEVPIDRLVA